VRQVSTPILLRVSSKHIHGENDGEVIDRVVNKKTQCPHFEHKAGIDALRLLMVMYHDVADRGQGFTRGGVACILILHRFAIWSQSFLGSNGQPERALSMYSNWTRGAGVTN